MSQCCEESLLLQRVFCDSVRICEDLRDNVRLMWQCEDLCDSVRICVTVWESVWQCEHLCDSVRVCVTVWGSVWQCEDLCDSVRICVTVWGVIMWGSSASRRSKQSCLHLVTAHIVLPVTDNTKDYRWRQHAPRKWKHVLPLFVIQKDFYILSLAKSICYIPSFQPRQWLGTLAT